MNESEKWRLLEPRDAQYHMYDTEACFDDKEGIFKGAYNLKFVSTDGKYEAVYNYDGILLDENNDPVNMGTYNYADPSNTLEHGRLDVKPYSDELYLIFLGGGDGWANVPGCSVDFAAHHDNWKKYDNNSTAQARWECYKEKMK